LEKLGLNLGYLIIQIANFFILFIVLRAWVYKPLTKMLEKRREAIAKGLEDARIAAEARANAENEAAKIMADAQAQAGSIIREASNRTESTVKELKVKAEEEIARSRDVALAEAVQERDRMLGELRSQVAALAIAAAQKLVGESLDEKRQHTLLAEFFSGVKTGKVLILDDVKLSKADAEVTSALPLTADEKAILQKDLFARTGAEVKVSFRVDPSILGGLVIKVGDKLIDDSVAGKLESLRQTIS
jgi:F-type H+-transporting ATPase subunit b